MAYGIRLENRKKWVEWACYEKNQFSAIWDIRFRRVFRVAAKWVMLFQMQIKREEPIGI